MTPQEFRAFWSLTYPDTFPLAHLFKQDYKDRWFRIHSLPESKRYAETDEEWTLLLERHNKIITDVLGDGEGVLLITGNYGSTREGEIELCATDPPYRDMNFTHVDNVCMYDVSGEEKEKDEFYRVGLCAMTWKKNAHNSLLRDFADWKISAYFISINNEAIVAPYDGGIDFVLKDTATRDAYKHRYWDWLSSYPGGL